MRRVGDSPNCEDDVPSRWTEGSFRRKPGEGVEDSVCAGEDDVYERSGDEHDGRHDGVGRG